MYNVIIYIPYANGNTITLCYIYFVDSQLDGFLLIDHVFASNVYCFLIPKFETFV